MMDRQFGASFARLCAHLQRGVLATAFALGSTTGAMASPLTLSHSFGFSDTTIPTFDTNAGALLGVNIQLNYMLQVQTFTTPDRIDDMCSATISGANVSVSAPGTPVLLSSSPSQTTAFQACDSFWIQFIQMDAAVVDPTHFDAFTSIGPGSLALIVAKVIDSVTVTAYDPDETRATVASWSGGGTVTYSYSAVPVPEPTTALMLTVGLAGALAHRYRVRRNSTES